MIIWSCLKQKKRKTIKGFKVLKKTNLVIKSKKNISRKIKVELINLITMYHLLSKEAVSANSCSTMETRDHAKNGVSPKDQMSRENNLNFSNMKKIFVMLVVVVSVVAFFSSCTDKEEYLDGTTWKSEKPIKHDLYGDDCETDITIAFIGNKATVKMKVKINGDDTDFYSANATGVYTYNKKSVTINLEELIVYGYYSSKINEILSGKVNNKTMTLHIATDLLNIDEQVVFKKQ